MAICCFQEDTFQNATIQNLAVKKAMDKDMNFGY